MLRSVSLIVICLFAINMIAQQNWIDTSMYQTNGDVYDIQKAGGLIYVTGSFSYAAKRFESFGHPVNITNGELFGNFPTPNGVVTAAVGDNNDGWYIAGDFTQYGDSIRHGLVHMTSDGQIDDFFQDRKVNGTTSSLLLEGNTLFVAGSFDGVGLLSAQNGAILSTQQGTLPLGVAALPYNDEVLCSVSDGNGGWFIGGNFTQVGSHVRNHIAHITSMGELSNWVCDTDNSVLSLAYANGYLYVGGNFTTIGGVSRNYLAKVDATTGEVGSWNPNPNGSVRCISTNSNALFVGGSFGVISNQSRSNGASYLLSNMQLRSWDPFADDSIEALVAKEDRVYLGGYFTSIDGSDTPFFSVVSSEVVSGTIIGIPRKPNDAVISIAVSDEYVALGGFFTQQSYFNVFAQQEIYENANHFYVYRISIDGTGNLFPNDFPHINDLVKSISIVGNDIYVGGSFTELERSGLTYSRNKLARLIYTPYGNNTSDFVVDEIWNPLVIGATVNVLSLSGDQVFVGGNFDSAAGDRRSNLFAVNTITHSIESWAPDVVGAVSDMVFVNDRLYFTGPLITQVEGQARSCAAAVSYPSGELQPWHPVPTVNNPNVSAPVSICGIEYSSGFLYVSGNFNTIGSTVVSNRTTFANLDLEFGNAGNFVYSDTYYNQAMVCGFNFAANDDGIFIGNKKFDPITGNVLSTFSFQNASFLGYPYASNLTVRRVLIQNNELITTRIGGGGWVQRNSLSTGALISGWDPQPNGIVNCVVASNNSLFIGGEFSAVGGQNTNGLFAYNPLTNRIVKAYTSDPAIHRRIAISGQTLYSITNNFSNLDYLTAFDVSSENIALDGALQSSNAGEIYSNFYNWARAALMFSGGRLFVSQTGYTDYCSTLFGSKLLSYNPETNAVLWNSPNDNLSLVNCFRKSGNILITGSRVLENCILPFPANPLHAYDATTGEPIGLNLFNPGVHHLLNSGLFRDVKSIDDLELDGYDVIMACSFNERNPSNDGAYDPLGFVNSNYYGVSKTNYNTGQMSSLMTYIPQLDSFENQPRLYKSGDIVFVNGGFTEVNASSVNNVVVLNANDLQPLNWYPNFNNATSSTLVDNGFVYVGGSFTSVEGQQRIGLVRMNVPRNVAIDNLVASYCPGSAVNVTLTSESTFASDNLFTVELSDANGGFANPLVVGSISGSVASEISITIPVGIQAGDNYRVRVIASAPYVLGSYSLPFSISSLNPILNLSAVNPQICAGTPVEIQIDNSEEGVLYDVYVNGEVYTQSTENSIVLNDITQNSSIYVVYTSTNACVIEPTIVSNTIQVDVTLVSAQLSVSTSYVCEGSLLTLTADSTGLPATTTYGFYANYPWLTNSVLLSTGSSPTYSFLAGADGSVEYFVELNTNDICSSSFFSPISNVVIHPLPNFPFISENASQLIATAGFSTYQWYYDGTIIDGAIGNSYDATQSGSYSVEVSNEFGCMITSPAYNFTYIGVNEHATDKPAVYPNPSRDSFLVSLPAACRVMHWSVYDAGARLILEEESASQSIELDASNWPMGVYWLKLVCDSNVTNIKLVKGE